VAFHPTSHKLILGLTVTQSEHRPVPKWCRPGDRALVVRNRGGWRTHL